MQAEGMEREAEGMERETEEQTNNPGAETAEV